MNLNINKYILSLIFTGFIFILFPSSTHANEINSINKYFGITDPNFNTMRSKDTESSTATYIVIGLLIAATIIPLATWWYFSK